MENRIEYGGSKALFCEAYDQAATAIAALHQGLPIPSLSLTMSKPDDWRYRDDVINSMNDLTNLKDFALIWASGSAAQHIALGENHPLEKLDLPGKKTASEFVRQNWQQIDAVAKRLLSRNELSQEELPEIIAQG